MTMTVADLDNPDLAFISDSQDVEPINEYLQEDYDSYFVLVGDGEYDEVYGMEGIVPYLSKRIWRVK